MHPPPILGQTLMGWGPQGREEATKACRLPHNAEKACRAGRVSAQKAADWLSLYTCHGSFEMIFSPGVVYAISHTVADYEAQLAFVSSGAGVSVCGRWGFWCIIVWVTKYNYDGMSIMPLFVSCAARLRSELFFCRTGMTKASGPTRYSPVTKPNIEESDAILSNIRFEA